MKNALAAALARYQEAPITPRTHGCARCGGRDHTVIYCTLRQSKCVSVMVPLGGDYDRLASNVNQAIAILRN